MSLELFTERTPPGGNLEWGTVGWEGDDEHVSRGEGTDDGYTLVKVQLFRGRRTNDLHPTDGQGHQLVCHISSGVTRIPKKGARVMIATPAGMESVMGGSVIIAVVEPTPLDQLQTDRVVMDFGDDTHVVIKAKSVSMMDYNNRFITVGTPRAGGDANILFQAEDGTGGAIKAGAIAFWASGGGEAKNMLQMTTTQTQCLVKGGGYMSVDANGFYAAGNNCSLQAGGVYCIGQVFLGSAPLAPSPTNACAYGAGGPTNLISTSVFISP